MLVMRILQAAAAASASSSFPFNSISRLSCSLQVVVLRDLDFNSGADFARATRAPPLHPHSASGFLARDCPDRVMGGGEVGKNTPVADKAGDISIPLL
jgi:hypothetical protein